MFGDDDAPRPVPRFSPRPLERLGVDELQAYISALQAEIERTETEIGRKRNVRDAADTVFRFGREPG